jgi:branched-chain amino acid transport system substrate-binding protein
MKKFCIVAIFIISACAPPSEAPRDDNAIVVGEYLAFTGPQAWFGESTHSGIAMAIDEINAAGGVKGRPIRIVVEDDQSRPDLAANAVSKLISQDGVVALLGEVASSNSLAGAPVAQSNGVPMLAISSTNPALTKIGDYIFRMSYIDPYQGESLANYMSKELGMKRAALLVDMKSDYSTGLAEYFEKSFAANGGRIVARQSYSEGDNDFRPQLTTIRAADPDVVFIPGYYNDIGPIAIQARELGIKQPLAGGDGWGSPKLIELGGAALEGSFYSESYFSGDPDPRVQNFVASYRRRYGRSPDALAALGYDAGRVMAAAIGQATAIDGPAIRDALAATKQFPGVTGNITFGSERDPIGKKIVILEVRNGSIALKDTIGPQN